MKRWAFIALAFGLLVTCALFACGGASFDPQSKVDSVRMLAVRADKPYAKPGETVTLDTLLTDQRKDKARPLKLFWIPIVCVNPRDDLYYLCFAGGTDGGPRFVGAGPLADAGAGAADGGAVASPLDRIPVGIDLSPFLPQGPTFSFRMPDDAIIARKGSGPYGLAIVFSIACAGKVVLEQRDPNGGPQQVPLVCEDENGEKVPPSDYVIGISRVYAYDTATNTNPVIEKVLVDDKDIDVDGGITVPKCVADRRSKCTAHKIDVHVSDSSWEANTTSDEQSLHEQIWVDYYTTAGDMGDDARLLFDTQKGRVDDPHVEYRSPYEPSEGTIWAVVHDNRGGAAWVVLPLHVTP